MTGVALERGRGESESHVVCTGAGVIGGEVVDDYCEKAATLAAVLAGVVFVVVAAAAGVGS